ncbi:type IV pilus secretin PilQ [Vibrio sp. OCN044]|uniref:Type IV pilus secretin PilQ n=1 Tax=Vibrio tetraodonis subsp. pristinus TaxID=2695891 RepID=A0A6L8LX12_9VIBR|nr:type IV pilus secretin PilQ [Vibrio tetraodonis]MYM60667.1 type IV pilus secretin PilQ [Vibrio tetraodonis subsp. pristinus]
MEKNRIGKIWPLLIGLFFYCQLVHAEEHSPSYQDNIQKVDISDRRLSVNFEDIPVRSVLQHIADYSDFNIVVSDSVSGSVTLRLNDVYWSQLLDMILLVKGLDKRQIGDGLLVFKKSDANFIDDALVSEPQSLQSAMIAMRFANATEIAAILGGDAATSMLSEHGAISVDTRTNALLIRDQATYIEAMKVIISALDVPVKQVQIEARIVSLSEGDVQELGVRWGLNTIKGNYNLGGSIENNLSNISLYSEGESSIDDFLNVDLSVASNTASTIAFQVAKLSSGVLLDLELSALQRESRAEVISSPRLITTNKQAAYIEQGTEIPYLEAASSGATSVNFKKAVLSLKVTPQITADNRLILDLKVTQDRPGQVVKTGTGEAVAIDTQRIGTQVLVNDGETIVLGGIYQHSVSDAVDKVPLLGDIPLLGGLFRRSYQQMGKSELLIFVTPTLITP